MKWFTNMRTAAKLIFGFVLVAIIAGAIGGVGIYYIQRINKADTMLYEKMTVPLGILLHLATDFERLRINNRDVIYAETPKERAEKSNTIEAIYKDIDPNLPVYEKSYIDDEDKRLFDEFVKPYREYVAAIEETQSLLLGTGETIDASTYAAGVEARVAKDPKGTAAEQAAAVDRATAILKGKGFAAAQAAQAALDKLVQMQVHDAKGISDDNARQANLATLIMIVAVAVGMVLAVILGALIAGVVSAPLRRSVAFAQKLAAGDLTQHLDMDRRDEAGELVKALNEATSSLHGMFTQVASGVQTLSSSSTELSSISKQTTGGAEQASARSTSVAAAVEELSTNMNSVSASMEQTSTNIATVAGSTEEMTSTIGEIARNSEKARTITGDAVSQAARINESMAELGSAAKEIGKVTETINAISSQTNLLALNATIEAARAGAAGKGFAVVANEIKELAKQTAVATEDIKGRIEGIQGSTTSAVDGIGRVSKVIKEVNEIVTSIAAAIEEQSSVMRDVAKNVAEAAKAVEEVNHNVSQSSEAVAQVAKDMSEVNRTAGEISTASSQVMTSAEDLAKLAEQLRGYVGQFTL
jgi:methyl-accepting chemotaxis protein